MRRRLAHQRGSSMGRAGYRNRGVGQVTTIYIDADACPVKDETYRVAVRYGLQVLVVADQYIQTPCTNLIRAVVVPRGEDAADDWIAERVGPGDIVITVDIPLAARSMEAGARALGHKGKEFSEDSIGDALASRELGQQLREMGIETGGPKPMTRQDRGRFASKLDALVNQLARQ